MARVPHLRPYSNQAYNPWETRVDWRWRCSVCGFAGIDPEVTQEPEQEVFSTITTGTTYTVATGTPVEGLATIDLNVFTQWGVHTSCPFCGSPNWAFGSAPDLLW